MSEIIDLKNSVALKLQKQIKEKEKEIAFLKKQVADANNRAGQLASINEMLKLSLADALNKLNQLEMQVQYFAQFIGNFKNNFAILKNKLPDMSMYKRKTVSEIKREIESEKGTPTLIDISKKDNDSEKD